VGQVASGGVSSDREESGAENMRHWQPEFNGWPTRVRTGILSPGER